MSSEGAAAGLLLVLSAPSGAGKTTLAHRLRASHADAVFSVSVTTRAPRGQERDGIDYHFVSAERFAALVAQGALAEWAEVHGQRYGTLRETVEAALRAGRIALFDIDVQGGAQLRHAFPRESATVFILPPSVAELERRLRGRSTDSEDVIARRLAAARAEVARGDRQLRLRDRERRPRRGPRAPGGDRGARACAQGGAIGPCSRGPRQPQPGRGRGRSRLDASGVAGMGAIRPPVGRSGPRSGWHRCGLSGTERDWAGTGMRTCRSTSREALTPRGSAGKRRPLQRSAREEAEGKPGAWLTGCPRGGKSSAPRSRWRVVESPRGVDG